MDKEYLPTEERNILEAEKALKLLKKMGLNILVVEPHIDFTRKLTLLGMSEQESLKRWSIWKLR
jgi:hypothetical protein